MQLRGQVAPGRGLASAHLAGLREALQARTGQALCPGSLNVVLEKPVLLRDDAADCFTSPYRMMVWPASIGQEPVWVYRWVDAPLHVAEVLSPLHLRRHLRLSDGDDVIISLHDSHIVPTGLLGRIGWSICWLGRRRWHYSRDRYAKWALKIARQFGATQRPPRGIGELMKSAVKVAIKRLPVVGKLLMSFKERRRYGSRHDYEFRQAPLDGCADDGERALVQVQNLLNYTKTSNSNYSAQKFPAGYHTITIGDQTLRGQRDPAQRLALAPIDFAGKTVLDLGSNQGGMLLQIRSQVRWAVGVDYDSRMVNAANRIKAAAGAENLQFYVQDLENEPLDLIRNFLPAAKADICFLLSVCMWLRNWKQVIDFAKDISDAMLFESNGSDDQQREQIAYLKQRYASVTLLSDTSEDDPSQKARKLLYCTD